MKFFGYCVLLLLAALLCEGQRPPALPFNINSFSQALRSKTNVPGGRSFTPNDIILRYYGKNSTVPTSYRFSEVNRLLADPTFDPKRPTVLFAHGYVELATDESVLRIVRAYVQRGGYNILVLDWSNMAFGNYLLVSLDVPVTGKKAGKALLKLLKGGLSLKGLHLVGHSLGAHLLSFAAKALAAKGFTVPRLTGLDPAYPGFYPPLLAAHMSSEDADFVDVIHTDGGGFGAPSSTGHADFWPNGGQAKQPGCLSFTVPLSNEDFCSHWRSWAFWAESVEGSQFMSRKCLDYDAFLRGQCHDAPSVSMGLGATSELRGNFYLRTATRTPYSLGIKGAE
ncbi:pancreatic triacylglycerol lipase isoform X2 [Bombyx mori]|uniref:Lipase domain-containing protein n=1 Tax=Bombyx mori TaxID=7091 RepID=A0A8R2QT55_BOMMO|nr:pancreatic triacylglycerol lipase isoform X1 [Bombyx mori]